MTSFPAPGLLGGTTVAIVGVGPGLGRDLSLRFAAAGADLVLAARRPEVVESVAEEARAVGREARVAGLDVTSAASVDALFAAVAAEGRGRLDTVVYNASRPPSMVPIADSPDETWGASYEVHVVGAARAALSAAPLLEASGGSLVFINSQAMRRSEPRRGIYAANKAAQLSLSRTLAGELGPRGIRVNTVVPGHIMGPPLREHMAARAERLGTTLETVLEEVARPMALRRIATGTEVADAAVFLASPLASGITGQTLDVNAGNWYG